MRLITNTVRNTGAFTRNVGNIRRIAIHHSGVARVVDCLESLNRHRAHWRSIGWSNDGYHLLVARDGRVFVLHEPNHVANGVFNHNADTYHICVEGLGGNITVAQRNALINRIDWAMRQFNVPIANVLGHNEFTGHQGNQCPSIVMATLRNDVTRFRQPAPQPAPTPSTPTPSQPSAQGQFHTVVSGDTLWGLSQRFGVTVAQLQNLNNMGTSTVLTVGQRLQIRAHQFFPIPSNRTGIANALQSIGVDSSFASRARIAVANGILNYTGTAQQNTTLLNKLVQGVLIRP